MTTTMTSEAALTNQRARRAASAPLIGCDMSPATLQLLLPVSLILHCCLHPANFTFYISSNSVSCALKSVLQLQPRHNSHTSHCYVILFGAGNCLDVIIRIMKHVQWSVSCPPCKRKVGVKIFSLASLATMYPHLQNRGAALGGFDNSHVTFRTDVCSGGAIHQSAPGQMTLLRSLLPDCRPG